MNYSDDVESVAQCQGYKDAQDMIARTGADPEKIDGEDRRTWPAPYIKRRITIDTLGGGSFMITDGALKNEGLTFDEMLGVIAALTMPQPPKCLQWMETQEQIDAREEHYFQMRQKRKAEDQITQQNS